MPKPLLISAAASLTDVITAIGTEFQRSAGGVPVRYNFAASSVLLQQIQAGAPVDVFVSASPAEINTLEKRGLLLPGTRRVIATNHLVAVVPTDSQWRGFDERTWTAVRRIAIANPASVPAGRYAQQWLERRKLWDTLKPRFIFGENVRQVLAYVASGDVDLGFIFRTDAQTRKARLRVLAEARSGIDHDPIVYPGAVLKDSQNRDGAQLFLRYCQSPTAKRLFQQQGFGLPNR